MQIWISDKAFVIAQFAPAATVWEAVVFGCGRVEAKSVM
jgi:hypothetical protein